MKHFHTTVDIEAPPDRIWTALRGIEHWPEWTPTVSSIRQLDPGPLAIGTRAIVRQPKLLPARWQVTDIEDGCGFTWITAGPGLLVTARHYIEGSGSCSRVTLSLDFSGPLGALVAGLTRGLNARYLALEAQGLKKQAETRVPSEASKPVRAGGSR
jgi:uncharacterized membrane protein